jgi:formiminotetrahydrofolate cyclodeaminase
MARKEAAEEMVAPAKKDYEEKLAVEVAMQTAAERSQQAYDRTVAAYTETINLLNAQAENGNTQVPTDEASEEITEQTALSEDVYTVFNNVKAIVMENPEIAQKFYEVVKNVSKNENAVQAITYAYSYVKSNVKISTINHYAKQLAGMEITPELVNKYLDMFINWINK